MFRPFLAAAILVMSATSTLAQANTANKSRTPFRKPAKVEAHAGLPQNAIVVKFKDGIQLQIKAPARAPGDRSSLPALERTAKALEVKERTLLERHALSTSKIDADLGSANRVMNEFGTRNVSRLFSTPEGQLTQLQTATERTARVELAYLTNYYVLDFAPSASAENAARLVNELNRLDSVEIAYIAPVPENAQSNEPTPDYAPKQGYLMPAPKGIDAQYAWQHAGGRGEGMRFADIEYGWLLAHEDLPKALFLNGKNSSNTDFVNHGTAVLGEIVAVDNGRGVTGIANRARFAVVSQQRTDDHRSVADAISFAMQRLGAGDVILIEAHARNPDDPGDNTGCTCNCTQFRFVPMEYFAAEYDAIQAATAKGIVVVEAGGNGGQNLDDPLFDGRFDRAQRDSGAILVGASNPSDRSPACYTNYGSRLDVHAWGSEVTSTGYGNMDPAQSDPNRKYTKQFSGTSSASPIVTGAALVVQGIRRASGLDLLSPTDMRSLLTSTGTPSTGSKHIGPLPDLRKAIDSMLGTAPQHCQAPVEGVCGSVTIQCDRPLPPASETIVKSSPIGMAVDTNQPSAGVIKDLGSIAARYQQTGETTAEVCVRNSPKQPLICGTSFPVTLKTTPGDPSCSSGGPHPHDPCPSGTMTCPDGTCSQFHRPCPDIR
jgi:serine protease